MSGPGHSLPLAPKAAPGRRHLPLAAEARDVDRARARSTRSGRSRSGAISRAGTAARAPGARAPDELSTAEALDLVRQMAELGVHEVTLIGGEAYLRDDWLDDRRARSARAAMQRTMTTGGRGIDAERARGAAGRRACRASSVSIDGARGDARSPARRARASHAPRSRRCATSRAAGIPVSANTQINRLSLRRAPGACSRRSIAHGVAQLADPAHRRRWVAPPTSPTCCSSRTICSSCSRCSPTLAARCRRSSACGCLPATTSATSARYETALRGDAAARPQRLVRRRAARRSASRRTATIKGCPSLPTAAWTRRQRPRRARCATSGSAPRRCATRAIAPSTICGATAGPATTPTTCRAGCTWTSDVLFGKPGNNPYCHHRALEMQRAGKRERLVQVERAPGAPFDHGRFELVVEDIDHEHAYVPVRRATVTSASRMPFAHSARRRCRRARPLPKARRRARVRA